MRLGHRLEIDLDVDLGEHGGDSLGDARILDIAVVGGHHGRREAVLIASLLHQRFRLVEVVARRKRGIVARVARRAELAGRSAKAAQDLLGDALAVDRVVDGEPHARVLERGLARSWLSSKVSTRVLGMVISVQQGIGLDAGEIGRRHRRDEIDIAGEQRRNARRRLLDRREHDLVDIAGRGLVPIIGKALRA